MFKLNQWLFMIIDQYRKYNNYNWCLFADLFAIYANAGGKGQKMM